MRDDHARRFLTERGVSWEARQAQERLARLEAAYSRLVEHEGQPPSIRQLAKAAQVSKNHAGCFLAERGVIWEQQQERARAARLEAAYARLVEQQPQPPSIRQLSKVAQVSDRHARRFLLEQQSQEKGTQA